MKIRHKSEQQQGDRVTFALQPLMNTFLQPALGFHEEATVERFRPLKLGRETSLSDDDGFEIGVPDQCDAHPAP